MPPGEREAWLERPRGEGIPPRGAVDVGGLPADRDDQSDAGEATVSS